MTLKSQSWIATILVTIGLLGVVASMSMKVLRVVAWPSLASIGAGAVVYAIVVRNLSRQISGQSVHVESMLAEAARLAAMRKAGGSKDGGNGGAKP